MTNKTCYILWCIVIFVTPNSTFDLYVLLVTANCARGSHGGHAVLWYSAWPVVHVELCQGDYVLERNFFLLSFFALSPFCYTIKFRNNFRWAKEPCGLYCYMASSPKVVLMCKVMNYYLEWRS